MDHENNLVDKKLQAMLGFKILFRRIGRISVTIMWKTIYA